MLATVNALPIFISPAIPTPPATTRAPVSVFVDARNHTSPIVDVYGGLFQVRQHVGTPAEQRLMGRGLSDR